METTKTFQVKVTYQENGAVKLEQYDKDFTPFELLGIISHVKNEIEADLLYLSKKPKEEPELIEEEKNMKLLLKTKLTDIHLSGRALNGLKADNMNTLAQLVVYQKRDLMKFRNFGNKTLIELEAKLESLNLSFGMDISKYGL